MLWASVFRTANLCRAGTGSVLTDAQSLLWASVFRAGLAGGVRVDWCHVRDVSISVAGLIASLPNLSATLSAARSASSQPCSRSPSTS